MGMKSTKVKCFFKNNFKKISKNQKMAVFRHFLSNAFLGGFGQHITKKP